MSVHCPDCGAVASYGQELGHRTDCPRTTNLAYDKERRTIVTVPHDMLESCRALLELDKKGVLVPHGLGGHGRSCLEWAIGEIERLRASQPKPPESINT